MPFVPTPLVSTYVTVKAWSNSSTTRGPICTRGATLHDEPTVLAVRPVWIIDDLLMAINPFS